MRHRLVRTLTMLALAGIALWSVPGSSAATTRCEAVEGVGLVCVTLPDDGVEVFLAHDQSYQRVTGVGLECIDGHYYAQYQLGDPSTYRPVALIDLGRRCPLFR